MKWHIYLIITLLFGSFGGSLFVHSNQQNADHQMVLQINPVPEEKIAKQGSFQIDSSDYSYRYLSDGVLEISLVDGNNFQLKKVKNQLKNIGITSVNATLMTISSSNVTVTGLDFVDDLLGIKIIGADNVTVSSSTLGNQTHSYGIQVVRSSNVLIKGITFTDYSTEENFTAIELYDSINVTVSNIDFNKNEGLISTRVFSVSNVTNLDIQNVKTISSFTVSGEFEGMSIVGSENVNMQSFSLNGITANGYSIFELINTSTLTFDSIVLNNLNYYEGGFDGFLIQNSSQLNITSVEAKKNSVLTNILDPSGKTDFNLFRILNSSSIKVETINLENLIPFPYGLHLFLISNGVNINIDDMNTIFATTGVFNGVVVTNSSGIMLTNFNYFFGISSSLNFISLTSVSNATIDSITSYANVATAKLELITLNEVEDVDFNLIALLTISSYSSSFPSLGFSIQNSRGIKLNNSFIQSVISSTQPVYAIKISNSSDFLLNNSQIVSITSELAESVGVYIDATNNSMVSNSQLNYIQNTKNSKEVNDITSSKLSSVVLDDKGYGFVIVNSQNTTLFNNILYSTDIWMTKDAISTLTLINNTVNGLESNLISLIAPNDQIIDVENQPVNITWTAITNPVNSTDSYAIYLDGDLVQNGTWISGEEITYTITNISMGVHLLEIVFTEASGFNTSDIVIIEIKETKPPVFIQTEKSTIVAKDADYSLEWRASDENPDTYSILRNGTEIDFGHWNANESIIYSLSTTTIGTWNFTIIIRDIGGNENRQTIFIQIVEPVDLFLVYGDEDITFYKGDVESFNFLIHGLDSGNYTVSIDGVPTVAGTWKVNEEIQVNITDLSIGSHKIIVVADDPLHQSLSFDVLVTVLPPKTTTTTVNIKEKLGSVIQEPAVSNNLPIFASIIGAFVALGLVVRYKQGKMPRLNKLLKRKKKSSPPQSSGKKKSKKSKKK